MKSALVLVAAALLPSIVVAQNRPASGAPLKVVWGIVESVSGQQVYVKSGLQLLAVTADENTEIWKGKTFHSLSPFEVGDRIIARCRQDASGNLIAEMMRLNGVNFSAVITKVTGNGFEMFTNPNADPHSAYVKENRVVSVDQDTAFEESAREDLRVGRDVQVVGLDLKDGTIRATLVTVYEGKRPVRMPANTRIIMPNGQIR